MIRISRTRRNDPATTNKFAKPLSHLYYSHMLDLNASSDDIVVVASVEDIEQLCLLLILGHGFELQIH